MTCERPTTEKQERALQRAVTGLERERGERELEPLVV